MGDFLKLHTKGSVVLVRMDDITAVVPAKDEEYSSDIFIDSDLGISVDETTEQIAEAIDEVSKNDLMGL